MDDGHLKGARKKETVLGCLAVVAMREGCWRSHCGHTESLTRYFCTDGESLAGPLLGPSESRSFSRKTLLWKT